MLQVEESDTTDRHNEAENDHTSFGEDHEEVTAASVSSSEGSIISTKNVSRESGGEDEQYYY